MPDYFEEKLEELSKDMCPAAIGVLRKRVEDLKEKDDMWRLLYLKAFFDSFKPLKCKDCEKKNHPILSQLYNNENLLDEISNCGNN